MSRRTGQGRPNLKKPWVLLYATPVATHPPHEEVQLLIVGQRVTRLDKPDGAAESIVVSGSCTIVPGDAKRAYTAGRNLLGVKTVDNVCGGSSAVPVQVRYAPLWAVAITASGFFAITPAVWRKAVPSPDELRRLLLSYGGREATHYKTTIADKVAWGGTRQKEKADLDLCMLKFDTYLIGREALAASGVAAGLSSVKDLERVEVMQLGFPASYCSNPAVGALAKPPVNQALDPLPTRTPAQDVKHGAQKVMAKVAQDLQPVRNLVRRVKEKIKKGTGELQWVANTHMEQVEARFICPVADLEAGQQNLTMMLPTSCTRGDTGGGVYLVTRDSMNPGTHPFACVYWAHALTLQMIYALLSVFPGGEIRRTWQVPSCNVWARDLPHIVTGFCHCDPCMPPFH